MSFVITRAISEKKHFIICESISDSTKTYHLSIKDSDFKKIILSNLGKFILILDIRCLSKIKIASKVEARVLYNELKKLSKLKEFAKSTLSRDDYLKVDEICNKSVSLDNAKALFPKSIINQLEDKFESQVSYRQCNFFYKTYSSSGFFEISKTLRNILETYHVKVNYMGGHYYKLLISNSDFNSVKKQLESISIIKGEFYLD